LLDPNYFVSCVLYRISFCHSFLYFVTHFLSLYSIHLTLYRRHLTLYRRHLTLYRRHLTLYRRHLTLYRRQFTVYKGVKLSLISSFCHSFLVTIMVLILYHTVIHMTPYRRQIGTRLNSTVAQGLGSHSNTVKSHRVKSTPVKTNRHQLKPIDTS
jgi:hypothetical protein